MSYGTYFILSLLFTLLIEMPVLLIGAKFLAKVKTDDLLVWGVFANLFSLPYLWFVFPLFISSHYYILAGESAVILMEAIILSRALKMRPKTALILSFAANIVSYSAGRVFSLV